MAPSGSQPPAGPGGRANVPRSRALQLGRRQVVWLRGREGAAPVTLREEEEVEEGGGVSEGGPGRCGSLPCQLIYYRAVPGGRAWSLTGWSPPLMAPGGLSRTPRGLKSGQPVPRLHPGDPPSGGPPPTGLGRVVLAPPAGHSHPLAPEHRTRPPGPLSTACVRAAWYFRLSRPGGEALPGASTSLLGRLLTPDHWPVGAPHLSWPSARGWDDPSHLVGKAETGVCWLDLQPGGSGGGKKPC